MTTAEHQELEALRRRVAELERELRQARAGTGQPGGEAVPEALLTEAERAAQMGTWVWDLRTNAVTWSTQLFHILGYDPGHDLASVETFFDAVHPDDVEPVRALSQRAAASGETFPTAFRVRHRDGAIRECFMDAAPIHDAAGTLVGFVGTILDLTDRRRAERELSRSERLLNEAQRIAHVGSWAWDRTSNTLTWSEELYRICGVDPATPASADLFEGLVHPDDRARFCEAHRQATDSTSIEYRLVRPSDRSVRHVHMASQPIADEAGTVTGSIGILLDITERRRLEEQLLHSQKMEAVGRLAGGVAHDFNNMLTAIFGHIDLARRQLTPGSPMLEHLDQIRTAADRAASLTRQLLAFARRQLIQPTIVEPNALILGVAKLLRPILGEDMELNVITGRDAGSIRIDEGQLEQILINLAVNARDAMPDGGVLTIETSTTTLRGEACREHPDIEPGDYLEIRITDTGQGMDAAIQQYIFEPFFTTKESGKGSGLGLATCHGIVKQHGGHILFHSEPGRGTTFRIYFPRVHAPPDRASSALPAPIIGGAETILLVEDERQVRELCGRALRAFGYEVLSARTAKEAIAVAAAHGGRVDLLMTDVVLPDMRGTQLAAVITRARPSLRVLYASGYTEDVLDPGVSLLQKPYTPTQLAAAVRQLLDAPAELARIS